MKIKNIISSGKKFLLGSLTAAALTAGCHSWGLQNPNSYLIDYGNIKARPFAKFSPSIDISQPVSNVKNVPESIRYVPIHHDDDWIPESDNGPIADDSVKMPPLFELGLVKGGLETKIGDIGVELYANLSLNVTNLMPCAHDDWFCEVNERDYEGTPGSDHRGYGTALTYWAGTYEPLFIPGFNCDLSFPINENKDIIIGTGMKNYKIVAERGWDRYDKLDKRDTKTLAEVEQKSIYMGLRWNNKNEDSGASTVLKVGYNFCDIEEKEEGVKVDGNGSLFLSIGGDYLF